MVWLEGGPSHIDTYDMKPDAPAEMRGPFRPIQTNVPGTHLCELLPLQARIADKLAIVRNMTFRNNDHRPPEELLTGFQDAGRPGFGSVVSRLHADAQERRLLPPYVQLESLHDPAERLSFPTYLGAAHKPFAPSRDLLSLEPNRDLSPQRMQDRRQLLRAFDDIRRELDAGRANIDALDAFTNQALEIVSSPRARDAFDISREPESMRARYGPATQLLQARRLVEAGVKVVSVSFVGAEAGRREACGFGGGTWDTHGNLDRCLGHLLPQLDRAVHALATDLADRGLDRDVAVVFWGEMGRTPRITAEAAVARRRPPTTGLQAELRQRSLARRAAHGAGRRRDRPHRRQSDQPALHTTECAGDAVRRPRHRPRADIERSAGAADVSAR